MRVLLAEGAGRAGPPVGATADSEDDLRAAYPASSGRFLRANFVVSVDGAATVDGSSRGLSGAGDRRIFTMLREACDAILVGAGTARAEGYRRVRLSPAARERRQAAGRPPAPLLAVVSNSGRMPPNDSLADGELPQPVLLTCRRAARPVAGVDVVLAGDDQVDLTVALDVLGALGAEHVLCEGGPSLLGSLAALGRLDELCLTVSPALAGPGAPRMLAGPAWDSPRPAALSGLLEQDGALFARYRFAPPGSPAAGSPPARSASPDSPGAAASSRSAPVPMPDGSP